MVGSATTAKDLRAAAGTLRASSAEDFRFPPVDAETLTTAKGLMKVPGTVKVPLPRRPPEWTCVHQTALKDWAKSCRLPKRLREDITRTVKEVHTKDPWYSSEEQWSEATRFVQDLEGKAESGILAPDDKSPCESWHLPAKLYRFLTLQSVIATGWTRLDGVSIEQAENQVRGHMLKLLPSRWSHLKRRLQFWKGRCLPYVYTTIESKCFDALGAGRTCTKAGHQCVRKIVACSGLFEGTRQVGSQGTANRHPNSPWVGGLGHLVCGASTQGGGCRPLPPRDPAAVLLRMRGPEG